MTDITNYEAVITKASETQASLDLLTSAIFAADPNEMMFEASFDQIDDTLNSVKAWAQGKIDEAEQEVVMDNFLAELKVVFDKYSAIMEVGSNSGGYGVGYGEGSSTLGVKFTATFESVTAVKEINKAVIVGTDLT
jgi:hypothetical protein